MRLLDDLDDAPRAGVDKNRSLVDNRVAIFTDPVFGGNVVIGDTRLREYRADPYIAFITVRRPVLFHNVMPKARAFIHAQNAVYAAYDTSNRAANDCSDRTGSALAFTCTTFDLARYTLRRCRDRKQLSSLTKMLLR